MVFQGRLKKRVTITHYSTHVLFVCLFIDVNQSPTHTVGTILKNCHEKWIHDKWATRRGRSFWISSLSRFQRLISWRTTHPCGHERHYKMNHGDACVHPVCVSCLVLERRLAALWPLHFMNGLFKYFILHLRCTRSPYTLSFKTLTPGDLKSNVAATVCFDRIRN